MNKLKILLVIVILIVVFVGSSQAASKVSPAVPYRFAPAPCTKANFSGSPLMQRVGINYKERVAWIEPDWIMDLFVERDQVTNYRGEFLGKWLEAAVRVCRYSGDKEFRKEVDRVINTLLDGQEDDGYIGTYAASARNTGWDFWTIKYTLNGMLAYANEFQDERVLKACQRLGDYFMKHVEEITPEVFVVSGRTGGDSNTSILESMVLLYKATGNKKYIEFCPKIFHPHILPDVKKAVFGRRKAYQLVSNYLGLLKYGQMADAEFVKNIAKMTDDKINSWAHYPYGAISVGDASIGNVMPLRMEVYGYPWWHGLGKADEMASGLQKRNPRNGSEGCDTVTWMQLNFSLFHMTGAPEFLEEAECVAYNQLSAQQEPSTGSFHYFMSPHGVRAYAERHGHYCCMYSLSRGLAMLPDMAVGSMDGRAAVALYLPGEYRVPVETATGKKEIDLTIKTNFPVSGKGVIQVNCDNKERFGMALRVPGYATSFTAKAAGKTYTGKAGDFLTIDRKWSKGDKVEFDMQMEISMIGFSGRRDAQDEKVYAVKRGPQFLAVDSTTAKRDTLYKEWIGVQKYAVPVKRDGKGLVYYLSKCAMVPYGDAGQTGGQVEMFFENIEWKDGKAPASLESRDKAAEDLMTF